MFVGGDIHTGALYEISVNGSGVYRALSHLVRYRSGKRAHRRANRR